MERARRAAHSEGFDVRTLFMQTHEKSGGRPAIEVADVPSRRRNVRALAQNPRMPEYDVTAERDGRYLLVHIPSLNGVTQARFPGEVERMAADYIALVTDTPVEDIAVFESRVTCRRCRPLSTKRCSTS